jgi:4-hydroxy-3-polyprenylbenzoate decarboxylase
VAGHAEVARVHLVVSRGASQVLAHELGRDRTGAEELLDAAGLHGDARARVTVHRDNELDAAVSSGSYRLAGTVVLPASSGTIGALATGIADTLIHRAGAVALKERWPLLLGFRETPLSVVHLENLRALAYRGAVVIPPLPAFYAGGEDPNEWLEAYCQRLLDHLGLGPAGPGRRWRGGS